MTRKIKKYKFIFLFLALLTLAYLVYIEIREYHERESSIQYFRHELGLTNNNNMEDEKLSVFFRLHEAILASKDAHSKRITFNGNAQGIITGSPTGGYGNRLNSVLSTLLVAILLDTQVNIKWRHVDKFIQTPLKGLFDFDVQESVGLGFLELKMKSFYFKAAQPYRPIKNVNLLSRTLLPPGYKRYFVDFADPFYMEICSNSLYYNKLRHYGLASEATLRQALNASSSVSSSDKDDKLLQVGFEVGGNLLNRIWLPVEHLQRQIDFTLSTVFAQNYVIGLQMRYGSQATKDNQGDDIFLEEENDRIKFINCALLIENEFLEREKRRKSV